MIPARAIFPLALALSALSCAAQPDYMQFGSPIAPATADPAISGAIGRIDAAHIQETIETLVGFGTRNTLSSMEADLPKDKGINAAADWIEWQFEAISKACGGCLEVKRDVFLADSTSGGPWAGRVPRPTRITNVYAVLRGTDPAEADRIVLVTGHYDSRNLDVMDARGTAPGANDDASGVAVSLECARVLSKLHFAATIVFAAVAGEEQGLLGSAHLAQMARQDGWRIEAVLNNDIVGGNTTPGETRQLKDRVRVFSEGVPVTATVEEERHIHALGEENDSPSREVARAMAEVAKTYFHASGPEALQAVLIARPDRYLRGGDHMSFNAQGFPAVRLTEWLEDFHHQHQNVVKPPAGSGQPVLGDLTEFVDFHYVAQVARLNAATLATLAAAPGEPGDVRIDMKQLNNDTTLRWEAPDGGRVAQYQVVWRETTAPDWQFGKLIAPPAEGDEVSAKLPVSKDNVVFGVRSLDEKGHASPAVAPGP